MECGCEVVDTESGPELKKDPGCVIHAKKGKVASVKIQEAKTSGIPLCHLTTGRGLPETKAEAISAGKEHARINRERMARLGIVGVYRQKGSLYDGHPDLSGVPADLRPYYEEFFKRTLVDRPFAADGTLERKGWLRTLARRRRRA